MQYYPLLLYSIVPLIASTLYTFLAKALNDFEEHPTQVNKKNALVIKVCTGEERNEDNRQMLSVVFSLQFTAWRVPSSALQRNGEGKPVRASGPRPCTVNGFSTGALSQ